MHPITSPENISTPREYIPKSSFKLLASLYTTGLDYNQIPTSLTSNSNFMKTYNKLVYHNFNVHAKSLNDEIDQILPKLNQRAVKISNNYRVTPMFSMSEFISKVRTGQFKQLKLLNQMQKVLKECSTLEATQWLRPSCIYSAINITKIPANESIHPFTDKTTNIYYNIFTNINSSSDGFSTDELAQHFGVTKEIIHGFINMIVIQHNDICVDYSCNQLLFTDNFKKKLETFLNTPK